MVAINEELRVSQEERLKALRTPVGFARHVLGMNPTEKQAAVLWEFDRPLREGPIQVAVQACNEAGKTSNIAAPLVLWWLSVFRNAQVVTTAGVFRQVKEQLWPDIKRHAAKLQGMEVLETTARGVNGSRGIGFSTDDPHYFEGWHGGLPGESDKGPLLIIVDEAKSVANGIFEAIERCNPQALLVMSSPGEASGEFHEMCRGRRLGVKRHKITALDCPWLGPKRVAEMELKWGKDHPLVQSMVWADFPQDSSGAIFTLRVIDKAMDAKPLKRFGERHAFCDFAGGGDENVLALRNGNVVTLEKCWREVNTMAAVGEFIVEFQRLKLRAEEISGDAGGAGQVMCDRLQEMGWPINRVLNQARANEADKFENYGAETWWLGQRLFEKQELILPNDDVLRGQLSGRLRKISSRGLLGVESKEDMKKRGVSSPDRADAVLGCLRSMPKVVPYGYSLDGGDTDLSGFADMVGRGVLAGMDAGL